MPVEHGSRPRPIGQPNYSADGVGGGSGKLPGDRPFTLLRGKTPLGEPIHKRRLGEDRQTEPTRPTLRQEIHAYLEERARLRAEGQLPQPEDKPPIVTPADAISVDLHALLFSLGSPQTDGEWAKYKAIIYLTNPCFCVILYYRRENVKQELRTGQL